MTSQADTPASHTTNPMVLPDDLPLPENDGAAGHLAGLRLPSLALQATSGELVDLSVLPGRTVVYAYPMTGIPNVALPRGWNDIPGARGCTPQTLAFRDQKDAIAALGAKVFGLSTQTPAYQKELSDRLTLSFSILSDAAFRLTDALRLPTMIVEDMRLLKRLTLILNNGVIEHVFYPVFPPDKAALEVIAWLRANAAIAATDIAPETGAVIYTTAHCPHCKAAKALLAEKAIAFVEIDVGDDAMRANEMVNRSGGQHTVPQIFFGRQHIGGADALRALAQAGKLDTMLQGEKT